MRAPALLFLPALAAAPAAAETMQCHGPGQSYTAVFDPATRAMTLKSPGKPLVYKVLSVEGALVTGTTTDDGPTFRATFEGNRRIELFYHGRLMKTDLCR